MLENLSVYTSLAIQLIKDYAAYSRNSVKLFKSDELITDCVARLVKSDEDFGKRKSNLDLKSYRRMNVYYTIRTYLHKMKNRKTKTYSFMSSNDCEEQEYIPNVIYEQSPLEILERDEEINRKIAEINRSDLSYKEKKYIIELVNGKMLKEIVRENKTVGPSVRKIVKQGLIKLKGE